MSFVKKAVKKVFKFTKRLIKNKIFQIVAIIALSVFTCGVAAGGFAAFSGVSTVGGFFTAVGQTMATGAAAIANGLGMTGTANAFAAKGGAAALKAGLVTNAGTAAQIAGTASQAAANAAAAGNMSAAAAQGATAQAAANVAMIAPAQGTLAANAAAQGLVTEGAKSGFMGSLKSMMGKKVLGDVTVGQTAATFVASGITKTLQGNDANKKRPNGFVAGDVARGGGNKVDKISYDSYAGRTSASEPQVAQADTAAQTSIGDELTVAGQMAREPSPQEQEVVQNALAQDPMQFESPQTPTQEAAGMTPEPMLQSEDPAYAQQQQEQGFNGLLEEDNPFNVRATQIGGPMKRSAYGLLI